MAPIIAVSSAMLTACTAAIDSVNSPILRYAAVVMYNTGVPIMVIAGLVKR